MVHAVGTGAERGPDDHLLVGVTPLDPVTFAVAPAILVATGVLAALVPGIRAIRVDPAVTLRQE